MDEWTSDYAYAGPHPADSGAMGLAFNTFTHIRVITVNNLMIHLNIDFIVVEVRSREFYNWQKKTTSM